MTTTTPADTAQFLARLQPSDPPVYQAPTAADPITGAMIQGIKFRGVVPTRDPRQSAAMQPRNIISLPDSRIDPITSNRSGARVFRFNGNAEQYIYYLNMLSGMGTNWAFFLYFNLDSINNINHRTVLQTTGPTSAGEIDIGITTDGKLEINVMSQTQKVQLKHNSCYIGLSYNSARAELSVQVNNTNVDAFTNVTLTATSIIFGLTYDRRQPFGPGYLGAISVYPNQYYNLDQLSRLARYVPEPEPPAPKEEPPVNNNNASNSDSNNNTEAAPVAEPVAEPVAANDLELKKVEEPTIVVDPVTGERTVINDTKNNKQIDIPLFRQYNFQVPILEPPSTNDSVETFIATIANGVANTPGAQYISPTNNGHRHYRPN